MAAMWAGRGGEGGGVGEAKVVTLKADWADCGGAGAVALEGALDAGWASAWTEVTSAAGGGAVAAAACGLAWGVVVDGGVVLDGGVAAAGWMESAQPATQSGRRRHPWHTCRLRASHTQACPLEWRRPGRSKAQNQSRAVPLRLSSLGWPHS